MDFNTAIPYLKAGIVRVSTSPLQFLTVEVCNMQGQLRVVLFREGEKWIAQGLEHDICAQGKDLDEVLLRFRRTVHIENEENDGSLSHIGEAPRHFFKMWERSGKYYPEKPEAKADSVEYALSA
jgi:hypothetical protein